MLRRGDCAGGAQLARGGSHTGALNAENAIAEGLCSLLVSDYYYSSMLAAVGGLVQRGAVSRAAAWGVVSINATRTMQLADRGEIAPGERADLIVANWPEGGHREVRGGIPGGTLTRFGW